MPYVVALGLTLAVEVPIYGVVFRFARLLAGWRGWAAAIGVNLVTHPLAWALLWARPGWFLAVEAAVCAVEAGLLWALVRRDGALLALTALVANTASVLAGLALAELALT